MSSLAVLGPFPRRLKVPRQLVVERLAPAERDGARRLEAEDKSGFNTTAGTAGKARAATKEPAYVSCWLVQGSKMQALAADGIVSTRRRDTASGATLRRPLGHPAQLVVAEYRRRSLPDAPAQ